MIYEWGSRSFPVAAEVVGKAVEQIAKRTGGVCPPGMLVERARPERSPLHRLFEWDDEAAAESWRRQQARMVINSLVLVIEDSESRPPAFVHVRVQQGDNQREGYAASVEVMADDEMRDQALREALSKLRGLKRRFESLSELGPVWQALDSVEAEAVGQ